MGTAWSGIPLWSPTWLAWSKHVGHCCLPSRLRRRLDWKQNSQDSGWYSHGMVVMQQQLHLLYHCASPLINF